MNKIVLGVILGLFFIPIVYARKDVTTAKVEPRSIVDEYNNYVESNDFLNITSLGSVTTVKSTAGILHGVTISSKDLSSGPEKDKKISLYDSLTASGTKIGGIRSSTDENQVLYNAKFSTGLTVQNASVDMTVVYR